MIKKKINLNNWWLDSAIINPQLVLFKFSLFNKTFYLNLSKKILFYFFLINKNNVNSYYFYLMDSTVVTNFEKKNYLITYHSVFYDINILITSKFNNTMSSLSNIYKSSSWIERENKEFNLVLFNNLNDTRRLLTNYDNNRNLQFNNFNHILNDLHI